jgi:hypothetical protein
MAGKSPNQLNDLVPPAHGRETRHDGDRSRAWNRLLQGARGAALLAHKVALQQAEARHRIAQHRAHFDRNQPCVPAGNPDGGLGPRGGASASAAPIEVGARADEAGARVERADVLMDEFPAGVRSDPAEPFELLRTMENQTSSARGSLGTAGYISGSRTVQPDGLGFTVTNGSFGLVMQDPATGVYYGRRISVPDYVTATIVTAPNGHLRITFSRNV